jgi:hypothetical protein
MALVRDWEAIETGLPAGWIEARVDLELQEPGETDRVLALLAPVQPVRTGAGSVAVRIVRVGRGGPGPAAFLRALGRLEKERLHGTLDLLAVEESTRVPEAQAAAGLPESWDAALATLPADWSDLLGEIELDSSDYLEPATLHLAPINPRQVGMTLRLQFRSASRFGYGAAPGMVRRCLERCAADGMTGRVELLRALSDTQPVATQGPVWQIDGRMV